MPELWVVWGYGYRFVVVRMSVIVFLKVQVNVAPVEIEEWVVWILGDGFVIVGFSVFQSPDVVVSESSVVIVETMVLYGYGLSKLLQCVFEVFLLEERQPQVVMCACLIVSHIHCLFQVFYR
jgi:hypothetical protein